MIQPHLHNDDAVSCVPLAGVGAAAAAPVPVRVHVAVPDP